MKPRPSFLLPPLLALSLTCLPLQARQAIVLHQQMDAETFHQAGLDKLSPTELQQLQQWLSAHAAELASAVPASDAHSATAATGKKRVAGSGWFGHKGTGNKNDRVVISPFVGRFQGWQAGNIIALQNGQKWRVIDGSLVVPHPMEHPEITVKPGAVGGWLLKVKGYNSSARVEPAN